MSRLRFALRTFSILLGLFACLPLHFLWRLFGRRSLWPRRFLAWVGYCAGLRIRPTGKPLGGPVLFVANHSSWLDIMLVAGASGAAFVSKAEVRDWPLIGRLARLHHTVFVERGEKKTVRGQADALREALGSGRAIALFPEGTTDGGDEVLPFRPSLLAALYPPIPGVRVQPVAIDYGAAGSEIEWVGDEAAAANAKRVLSRRGTADVTLRFLEPLDPASVADRKALAELSRAAIVGALTGDSDGL